jgi:galactose mutarotase-like enzyme
MRSGLVTGFFLAIVALVFVLAYRQHAQGNFHKLKQRMADQRPQESVPLPGGQEAIELTRTRSMEDAVPEFLSATLLPGRGMNVLQVHAFIPGTGEMDLLASPEVDAAAAAMTGKGADAGGMYSLNAGGAFEVPWAGRIWSSSPVEWEGRSIALPLSSSPWEGGLMLAAPSDSSTTSALPDGGQAEATFSGFDGFWPSRTDVKVAVLLSGHIVDLTVIAHNTGSVPEPIGIGWTPRFAIQNGARSRLRLHIPGESIVEMGGHRSAAPTGRLTPVAHTAPDFSVPGGAKLPEGGMDLCFADLDEGVMDNGPAAELSDTLNGYKLRVTALSPEIKAMRVFMPADGSYISIDPQFNYPDPFGHEWDKAGATGMVVLQPGQSTEWKVRLEILPLNGTTAR